MSKTDQPIRQRTVDDPVPVTLKALLAAKERRAARQRAWLTEYRATLVSLTLVTPGPVKDSAPYRLAMGEAIEALNTLCRRRGWPVLAQQTQWLATGAEGFWAIGKDAPTVKAAAIALEERHPLGRLWDIDVICPREGAIGRAMLAHEARRCLLCQRAAHACGRSRNHPLPELVRHVEGMLNAYFNPA
ncbi:citrate lyase holo-[acyl-carrier protein] synthase [Brenneria tiliae]|uniref:Apo-citrate lyase phosphoribosyl-dephospho-CoA transferase n=1 Tax=Brenneria tiliae TaxID=2914984 RepID=A0ABT0N052_9GAMM|nr:citrate lyase holo-[acyl-carrier protein] synthase [Brenneria tiliae]MCL2895476.1 citrate lyase holo-[acyl-carrier protein] synthase [Brenneria tiliae]MCL2899984.1 citrate lyase holo-[acyl-carrier protein] synthase [Brenneria tiliae]MCL2904529.1 citrate lyase holo-[acyl-carrier protein] synthase [Brenneria tiliae]